MGIISISDLEVATNTDIDEADIPFYQQYIDTVSAYIEAYTGHTFSFVEDETFVCRADSYGIIEFVDLFEVTTVEELDRYAQSFATTSYYFDGISSIYGLCSYGTYRVTVSYGSDDTPEDIAGLVTDLVAAGSGLSPSATAGLDKYRVGDVEESYGVSPEGVVTITSLQKTVLDRYNSIDTRTLRP